MDSYTWIYTCINLVNNVADSTATPLGHRRGKPCPPETLQQPKIIVAPIIAHGYSDNISLQRVKCLDKFICR